MKYVIGRCPFCGKPVLVAGESEKSVCSSCGKEFSSKEAIAGGIREKRKAIIERAQVSLKNKKYGETRKICEDALSEDPTFSVAYQIIGLADSSELSLLNFTHFDFCDEMTAFANALKNDKIASEEEKDTTAKDYFDGILSGFESFLKANEEDFLSYEKTSGLDYDFIKRTRFIEDVLVTAESFSGKELSKELQTRIYRLEIFGVSPLLFGIAADKKKVFVPMSQSDFKEFQDHYLEASSKLATLDPKAITQSIPSENPCPKKKEQPNAVCPICGERIILQNDDVFSECPVCHKKIVVKDSILLLRYAEPVPDEQTMVDSYHDGDYASSIAAADKVLAKGVNSDTLLIKAIAEMAESTPVESTIVKSLKHVCSLKDLLNDDKKKWEQTMLTYGIEAWNFFDSITNYHLAHFEKSEDGILIEKVQDDVSFLSFLLRVMAKDDKSSNVRKTIDDRKTKLDSLLSDK
jgi:uncharacterized Zn finger protein (UPF0148 family)